MNLLWRLFRKCLFRFDAEAVHDATKRLLAWLGRDLGPFGRVALRGLSGFVTGSAENAPRPVAQLGPLTFENPIGLAAGFDKNAEMLEALPPLGFGFAEIGTITPRPQPGNPRPRLFRDASGGNLFNCMGFNNLGAAVVAQRLEQARPRLPASFKVGVNVGKNKDTPLEGAADDYARAIDAFGTLADYFVINVSSPNTPGLRALQTEEALRRIVGASLGARRAPQTPVLVKLAPEIFVEGADPAPLIASLEPSGIAGWVVTNTWGGEWKKTDGVSEPLAGGWSGERLRAPSRRALVALRALTRLPIISVGGIDSIEEAAARFSAGASLVQLYTGWIYGGPGLPRRLSARFSSGK